MIAIVCGGRDYRDWERVNDVLTWIAGEQGIDVIIHGGARGADALAGEWAELTHTAVQVFKADWKAYGKAAGPLRNLRMLEECRPDIVIAFPGGKGTADGDEWCIRRDGRKDIPCNEGLPHFTPKMLRDLV